MPGEDDPRLARVMHEFKRIDKNGDGVLSPDELFEGLQGRFEQDEIQELFTFMDTNKDGQISLEEFVEGWEEASDPVRKLPGYEAPVRLMWEKEDFNCHFVKIGEGIWTLSSRHQPGEVKLMPEINNRCFAFKVTGADGTPELLLFGLPGKGANGEHPHETARRFATEQGLPVRRLMVQGGLHVMYIHRWAEAFPEATVYYPPARVPFTASGRKAIDAFGQERVRVLPAEGFKELVGQFEYVILSGLKIHKDVPAPGEGSREWTMDDMTNMDNFTPIVPHDEVFGFFPPAGLLIGGDNMSWYWKKGTMPKEFEAFGMMEECVGCNGSVVKPITDEEKAVCAQGWKAIFAKPITQYISFHEFPGCAVTTDAKRKLEISVQQAGQM